MCSTFNVQQFQPPGTSTCLVYHLHPISCVRQVQQKDLRYVGSSKAAGAERSPWRELSGAPAAG